MTKTCKKILLTVFLALCFVLCVGAFAACDEANDEAVTYTVTVQTDATTPAKGVKVRISKGSAKYPAKTTDDNGKAVFELAPDDYTVTLSSLPEHYDVPASASLTLTKDNHELTVTLEKKFAYTVKLVNPDNTPYHADGVTVGICTLDGNCLTPVAIGTDGVAIIENAAGNYHVKVYNLPKTKTSVATVDTDIDGYYSGENFSATKTEMTITVTTYDITSVSDLTPMTDAQKTTFHNAYSPYEVSDLTAYHCNGTLAVDETKYFSFTPTMSGDYKIYINKPAIEIGELDTPLYLYNDVDFTDFRAGQSGSPLSSLSSLQAGKTYYFNVHNPHATKLVGEEWVKDDLNSKPVNFEFVVESPAATTAQVKGAFAQESTVSVTISKADANAVLVVTPTVAESLELTVQGEQLTSIKNCASDYYAQTETHTDFTANPKCSGKITEKYVGGSLYFSIAVKGDATFPVTFDVKIKRIKTLTDTTTTATVDAELEKYEKPTGKELKAVSIDDEGKLVKGDDGYYHLNSKTGDLVFVNINELAYRDEEFQSRFQYVLDVTSEADKADPEKGNSYKDYRLFIRGFENYAETKDDFGNITYTIPKTIAEKCYANFANTDGVYRLNDELLEFVKYFYSTNANNFWEEDKNWMEKALYCYVTPVAADAIVGEYKFVRYVDAFGDSIAVGDEKADWQGGGTVGDDEYKLVIDKANTFTISQIFNGEYQEYESGTWSKDDSGVYTFTEPGMYQDPETYESKDLHFTVTIADDKITLTGVEKPTIVWEFQRIQQQAE